MAKNIHEELAGMIDDPLYEMHSEISRIQEAHEDKDHVHTERCLRLFSHILAHDEKTIMEVRQSYLQSISPDRIIVTSKRLIIVRPSFWGLWAGHNIISPTEIGLVPYKNIISVVMSRGKILCSINMRIHGFTDATSAIRNEGVIDGIRHRDAVKLTNYLEDIVEAREEAKEAANARTYT